MNDIIIEIQDILKLLPDISILIACIGIFVKYRSITSKFNDTVAQASSGLSDLLEKAAETRTAIKDSIKSSLTAQNEEIKESIRALTAKIDALAIEVSEIKASLQAAEFPPEEEVIEDESSND